jgi:hypothetical protein
VLPHFSSSLRLQALAVGSLTLVLAGAVLTDTTTPERARLAAATTTAAHRFTSFTSDAQYRSGLQEGVRIAGGSVQMGTPRGQATYAGERWSWSRWTSPVVHPGHSFTQLVPSWNITTPANTLVQIQVRARTISGTSSGWKQLGTWSTRDAKVRRTSFGTQADSVARVATDTLVARSTALSSYQLRVVLLRRPASTASPTVRSLHAVASRLASALPATSRRLLPPKTLNVPRYSQMTHRGQYPQYGGGGEAWCSPTSLSMLLGYYRALPKPANYTWVKKSYADPWVDHVARVTYDYGYRGTGNWPFNTAYAANLTGDAFVTRLGSLRDAERFIAAGIPLAASVSFSRGQLSGAPISATAGHLLVIAGFTANGDVVVNDPAAATNASVRRVYDRGQFERAWMRKSSGTVYVVRDASHPLPARGANRNW